MNTQTANPWIHRITRSIPEIWYIAILSVITFDIIGKYFLFSLFLVACIGLLIKQIKKKNGVISFIVGSIFGIISLYMLAALLSEYGEFPDKTAPNARSLIIGGGSLVGTSLVLATVMWINGIRKMY